MSDSPESPGEVWVDFAELAEDDGCSPIRTATAEFIPDFSEDLLVYLADELAVAAELPLVSVGRRRT